MSLEDLDTLFPMGSAVAVTWRGSPVRGIVCRTDPARKNRDGSAGAVLVRVGDSHSQTSLFIPRNEVRMV